MKKISALLSLLLLTGALALGLTACELDVNNEAPVRGIGLAK